MDDLNEQFDQTVDYLPLPAVQKYGVKPVTDCPGMLPHFPGTLMWLTKPDTKLTSITEVFSNEKENVYS